MVRCYWPTMKICEILQFVLDSEHISWMAGTLTFWCTWFHLQQMVFSDVWSKQSKESYNSSYSCILLVSRVPPEEQQIINLSRLIAWSFKWKVWECRNGGKSSLSSLLPLFSLRNTVIDNVLMFYILANELLPKFWCLKDF